MAKGRVINPNIEKYILVSIRDEVSALHVHRPIETEMRYVRTPVDVTTHRRENHCRAINIALVRANEESVILFSREDPHY